MRPVYLQVNPGSSQSRWWVPDWNLEHVHIGLAVYDPSSAGWSVMVTMDDPTGTYPQPVLNPSYPTINHGSSGAQVNSFYSGEVGGWGGNSSAVFSDYCFSSPNSGNVIGGISQPVAGIQLSSSSPDVVLTILQAGGV